MANTRPAPPCAEHWVLQRAGRYLVDASGRTASTPFPLALNFCVRQEAEDLAASLNAELECGAELWRIAALNIRAIIAAETDLADSLMGGELEKAA